MTKKPMNNKNLPFTISTEALLEALEGAEEIDTAKEWHNDVPVFLSRFKIEQGDYKVPRRLLHKLYKLYSSDPITFELFNRTLGTFFYTDDKGFCHVNIKPITIANLVYTKKKTDVVVSANPAIKKHFETFKHEIGLKKGTNWVEGDILYETYRFYCINKKIQKKLSYKNYIMICSLYFETKRSGSSTAKWFGIDRNAVDDILSVEDMLRVIMRRRVVSDKTKEKTRLKLTNKKRSPRSAEHKENLRKSALAYQQRKKTGEVT